MRDHALHRLAADRRLEERREDEDGALPDDPPHLSASERRAAVPGSRTVAGGQVLLEYTYVHLSIATTTPSLRTRLTTPQPIGADATLSLTAVAQHHGHSDVSSMQFDLPLTDTKLACVRAYEQHLARIRVWEGHAAAFNSMGRPMVSWGAFCRQRDSTKRSYERIVTLMEGAEARLGMEVCLLGEMYLWRTKLMGA